MLSLFLLFLLCVSCLISLTMATSKNKRYRALRKNVSGPTKEQRKKEETALHEAGLRRGSTKLANVIQLHQVFCPD